MKIRKYEIVLYNKVTGEYSVLRRDLSYNEALVVCSGCDWSIKKDGGIWEMYIELQ